MVTDFASGTTLDGDSTLLSEFEALYTSSPTTQETTDLTTACNALGAAVTSSNITSADITPINTDWAAVLAPEGSTSTATFPYFTLVTGQALMGLAMAEWAAAASRSSAFGSHWPSHRQTGDQGSDFRRRWLRPATEFAGRSRLSEASTASGARLRSLTGKWLPQPLALGFEEDEVMLEMLLITFDHPAQGDDAGTVVSPLPRELGVG